MGARQIIYKYENMISPYKCTHVFFCRFVLDAIKKLVKNIPYFLVCANHYPIDTKKKKTWIYCTPFSISHRLHCMRQKFNSIQLKYNDHIIWFKMEWNNVLPPFNCFLSFPFFSISNDIKSKEINPFIRDIQFCSEMFLLLFLFTCDVICIQVV